MENRIESIEKNIETAVWEKNKEKQKSKADCPSETLWKLCVCVCVCMFVCKHEKKTW